MNQNEIEQKLDYLQSQIEQINSRNSRVQIDKAWETSRFRVVSLCFLTWIVISLVFRVIGVEAPLVNAIIPTIGFFLSTQSLPVLKKLWVSKYYLK